MEAEIGNQTKLIERLLEHPEDFDFSQAVRILRNYLLFINDKQGKLSFKNSSNASFPLSDVEQINAAAQNKQKIFELIVSFMGFTGQNGVLPEVYTEILQQQISNKDNTLSAFLDIFHNRIIKLFSDVSNIDKYYVNFEQARSRPLFDKSLAFIKAVSGQFKTEEENQELDDDMQLYYAGLLKNKVRTGTAIARILQDYFSLPITISNYEGEWIKVNQREVTYLSKNPMVHNGLGIDAILGGRVWHVQNRFNVRIGPVDYSQFKRLLPNGDMLSDLKIFLKRCMGVEYCFSVSLILQGESVPKCYLQHKNSMRLGWNSWLKHKRTFSKYVEVKLSDQNINLFGEDNIYANK